MSSTVAGLHIRLPCSHQLTSVPHLLQGVGNFVNVAVLCILMPIFGIATPNHPKNKFNNKYGAPR